MSGPLAAWLDAAAGKSRRLHLQHGPIDLIIEAFGTEDAVTKAYRKAWHCFQGTLAVLVGELDHLRQPLGDVYPLFRGPIARRMAEASWPHRNVFITPMAAVAGSVADDVLAAMLTDNVLDRAYVNNGGDIAFHLSAGQTLRTAVVCNPEHPHLDAIATLNSASLSRGLATSGWRGRSFSLGIADAVTILAENAAIADAAATIVANAVNVDHPAIERAPARSLRDDTDLGDLPVTVTVGVLPFFAVQEALSSGMRIAQDLCRRGLIQTAFLSLQGESAVVGGDALMEDQRKVAG